MVEKPSAKELIDFLERSVACKKLSGWQRLSIENWLEFVREGTVASVGRTMESEEACAIWDGGDVTVIRQQIEDVKSIHTKMLYSDRSGYGCESCSENWPCQTITILTDNK